VQRVLRRGPRLQKKLGEVVYKGHYSYSLMLELQLGIRYSVGRALRPRSNTPRDMHCGSSGGGGGGSGSLFAQSLGLSGSLRPWWTASGSAAAAAVNQQRPRPPARRMFPAFACFSPSQARDDEAVALPTLPHGWDGGAASQAVGANGGAVDADDGAASAAVADTGGGAATSTGAPSAAAAAAAAAAAGAALAPSVTGGGDLVPADFTAQVGVFFPSAGR
jgi:hypothetical protein